MATTAYMGRIKGYLLPIQRRDTNTCTRCSHTFSSHTERMIDVQYPSYRGQAATVTYRCRNKKACQKRAKKD